MSLIRSGVSRGGSESPTSGGRSPSISTTSRTPIAAASGVDAPLASSDLSAARRRRGSGTQPQPRLRVPGGAADGHEPGREQRQHRGGEREARRLVDADADAAERGGAGPEPEARDGHERRAGGEADEDERSGERAADAERVQ